MIAVSLAVCTESCKCNRTQPNQKDQLYLYSFEKTAPVTTDNSKQMINEYLGIKDVNNLTLNKDENVVYFVSDADVNTTFEQNLSNGNFEFNKLTKAYDNLVPQLPSKDEAVKLAENFMKSKNIFPENAAQLQLIHNGGVRSQDVINGQKAGPVVDKLITLTYGRVLDSIQVIGSGSKIIINIGDKGEVVGLIRRWRELNISDRKLLKPEEMFTQSEAEEQARKQVQAEFGQAPFEIVSSSRSYYDANGNYIQPVWAFNVMVNLNQEDKNVQAERYLCVIPMLKNSPEPLKLNALDPRAKQLIQSGEGRDSTQQGGDAIKNND
jgi:hypothetical protein